MNVKSLLKLRGEKIEVIYLNRVLSKGEFIITHSNLGTEQENKNFCLLTSNHLLFV